MKKYENIIFELNGNLPEGWDHEYFSYETAGYYECIKFGYEILWDSENYGEQKDLALFVKQQYNKYINNLKKVIFKTPLTDNVCAYDAVSLILDDIQSRKGLGNEWEQIDEETQDDIFQGWVTMVERNV